MPRAGRQFSSIAAKIGCTAQTRCMSGLRRPSATVVRRKCSRMWRAKLKALERENRELRQANGGSARQGAYFAQAEARPPVQAYEFAFIDDHRQAHGVEPICR